MRSNDGRENLELRDAPVVTILTFLTNMTCFSSGIFKVILLLNPGNKAFWILLEPSIAHVPGTILIMSQYKEV